MAIVSRSNDELQVNEQSVVVYRYRCSVDSSGILGLERHPTERRDEVIRSQRVMNGHEVT